jgi:DNA recombination protein RmuC
MATEIISFVLLLLVLAAVAFNLYLTHKWRDKSDELLGEQKTALHDLDQSLKNQKDSLGNLVSDIQSFQEPLSKLRRYLSGGTLAGTFGEWSLEAIITDIFSANKYEKNVEITPGSGKRVEFVIKLPEGLLPIDAKFPSALYDNYIEAADEGNRDQVRDAENAIKRRVISDATDIKEKYVQTGITIDLGIMYIPSESLMQLIDRLEGLREQAFSDSRVLILGPNSLAAYLISIHMGFRTLALNERAGEILEEFGKLKKEFEKFGSTTADLRKKAEALLKEVDEYAIRERQMKKAIDRMDQLDQ